MVIDKSLIDLAGEAGQLAIEKSCQITVPQKKGGI